MTSSNVRSIRLSNQRLSYTNFKTPEEVVDWFGAMQAQDYYAAQWSLGQRVVNSTQQMIEEALNEGKILRTHVMRPTWHFVHPNDIRWMLELTAPRVKQFMGHYNRKLELTHELFLKTNKTISKVLRNNNFLTRQELKTILSDMKITTDIQRLAHIIMWAELDGIICSGPRRGLQQTYALVDERAPKAKTLPRDEALSTLAMKYFRSHGPAQVKDFAWWSGLTIKDAALGLDMIKSRLVSEKAGEKEYWFAEGKVEAGKQTFLLSIFDEYTVAYKDRSDLGDGKYFETFIKMGNALTSVMIVGGQLIGTWKRTLAKDSVLIVCAPLKKLTAAEKDQIEKAGTVYGKFLGLKAVLSYSS